MSRVSYIYIEQLHSIQLAIANSTCIYKILALTLSLFASHACLGLITKKLELDYALKNWRTYNGGCGSVLTIELQIPDNHN